jgi:hypothetical protein
MLNIGSPLSPYGATGNWNDPDYPASGTGYSDQFKSHPVDAHTNSTINTT